MSAAGAGTGQGGLGQARVKVGKAGRGLPEGSRLGGDGVLTMQGPESRYPAFLDPWSTLPKSSPPKGPRILGAYFTRGAIAVVFELWHHLLVQKGEMGQEQRRQKLKASKPLVLTWSSDADSIVSPSCKHPSQWQGGLCGQRRTHRYFL